jgi:hypothetical protein
LSLWWWAALYELLDKVIFFFTGTNFHRLFKSPFCYGPPAPWLPFLCLVTYNIWEIVLRR